MCIVSAVEHESFVWLFPVAESEDMFKQLSPQSLRDVCLVMDMGTVLLKNELLPAMSVYQARTG